MQLLAKFKKFLYSGFRATLNFRKFKVALNPKLRVFLAVHSVVMVTYSVTKIIPTCSPMNGQSFDTMIVTSTDEEWL